MATKQQIPVVAARLTEFQEEFSNLSVEDAQWAIMNGKEAAKLAVSAIINRPKTRFQVINTVLSEITATVAIPATTKKFIVRDKFKVNMGEKTKVKISFIGVCFKNYFLRKIEEPFCGSTIHVRELNKDTVDGPILSELGGQEKAETTLGEIFAMMERQANGEPGELFTNGYANIFYARDMTGKLRVVNVRWDGIGWDVDSYSTQSHAGWKVGRQVFSHNSSVTQIT